MGTRKSSSGEADEKPEIRRYIAAAVYFLEHRCFSDCRSYALRAKESDPTYPGTTKILAIASVLSVPEITPTMPDYYTIFNLPRFKADTDQIGSSFETLTSILDPNVNPYPNSSEAFEVVLKGWSVLSNPWKRLDSTERADDKDKCNSEGMVGTTSEAKEVEDKEFRHLVKGKKMRSGGEASSGGFMSKCMDTEADILASRGSVVKETSRRRKSVAWRSKKKMGRCYVNDVAEEWKLHVNGNADYESGFGDVRNKDVGGGVEFFEGDDDVLVGVQSAFGFGIDEYL
ncbi:hypothetical protein F511_32969 [Dorcoceras hygrometricum]|uniref:Uncharacterized protein n=1 Tax=Dorcoceras hygrometricum TaxID=472368 RepID=A0A2Z7BMW2_9LAMI|nr:hypothetical protein F511_32969 [Dorcoceras hygrometricum]